MAKEYFLKRIPKAVKKLNEILNKQPVVLFMMAKKLAGKGTYTGHLNEATDNEFVFVTIGDLMREAEAMANMGLGKALLHDAFREEKFSEAETAKFLKNIQKLDQTMLYPTGYVVRMLTALLQEIAEENPGKSLVIDGLPRNVEQIKDAIALAKKYEKDGMKYFFVEIDCPDSVLEARVVNRRICPVCRTSRNVTLLLTPEIEYDKKNKEFILICDNPMCKRTKMEKKAGDELGLAPLAERQALTERMMAAVRKKVPASKHILVHNCVAVEDAKKHDPKDFTEEATLTWDEKSGKVIREFSPWVVKDNEGCDSYSRYSEPVAADLIVELVKKLSK